MCVTQRLREANTARRNGGWFGRNSWGIHLLPSPHVLPLSKHGPACLTSPLALPFLVTTVAIDALRGGLLLFFVTSTPMFFYSAFLKTSLS